MPFGSRGGVFKTRTRLQTCRHRVTYVQHAKMKLKSTLAKVSAGFVSLTGAGGQHKSVCISIFTY